MELFSSACGFRTWDRLRRRFPANAPRRHHSRFFFLYLFYGKVEHHPARTGPPLSRRSGDHHADHGERLPARRPSGRPENLHGAVPAVAFPGQEPVRRHAGTGRSEDRTVREHGEPLQLAAHGAAHPPRASRHRAAEVLDPLHGPLLRNDSPPGPPQRAHPFPVSDRQRGAP